MIELNWTFFVQIINFLILMLVLDKVLYKPILKILDERDERVLGGQEKTKELLADGETISTEYNEKIYEAKVEAMAMKNSARKETTNQANEIINDARKEAEEIISKVQQEMAAEIEKAKQELQPELANVAGTIAERIMGRKVA